MKIEILNSLISNSSNIIIAGMAIAQTIILAYTLWIGRNYFEDYQRKIKIQNNYRWVEASIDLLKILNIHYEKVYRIDSNDYKDLKERKDPLLAKKIVEDFFNRYEKDWIEIVKIKSTITNNIIFLNDPEIIKAYKSFSERCDFLYGSYLTFNSFHNKNYPPDVEYLLKIIPFSLGQKTNELSKKWSDSYFELLSALRKFYFF